MIQAHLCLCCCRKALLEDTVRKSLAYESGVPKTLSSAPEGSKAPPQLNKAGQFREIKPGRLLSCTSALQEGLKATKEGSENPRLLENLDSLRQQLVALVQRMDKEKKVAGVSDSGVGDI